MLTQGRAAQVEDKNNLQSRVDDLDAQLAASAKRLSSTTNIYKQVRALLNYFRLYTVQYNVKYFWYFSRMELETQLQKLEQLRLESEADIHARKEEMEHTFKVFQFI